MNQKTTVVKPIKKVKELPKLTPLEKEILSTCFVMANWEFEQLFVNNCIRIGHRILAWEKQAGKEEEKLIDVNIYGIEAKYPSVKYPIITKFYIHYPNKYRVYQRHDLEAALHVVELIEKDYLRVRYEQKISTEKEKLTKAA